MSAKAEGICSRGIREDLGHLSSFEELGMTATAQCELDNANRQSEGIQGKQQHRPLLAE